MAIKGKLCDFSVTQLLNLVNLARKTGTLVIEGPGEVAQVSFRDGKLIQAQLGKEELNLATVLFHAKKISPGQYRILRNRAGQMTDKELGLMLINAGYLTQTEILAGLQHYFIEVVRKLFTWVDGSFFFDAGKLPPDGKIPVQIDLENLIIEGSRQLMEWEQLQEEIPSLDIALKFAERPGANLRNMNLSVEEWRVVSYVNPKNSVRQIAKATRLNDLEIRRVVYSLLQAGLVELVRPGGQPPAMIGRMFPSQDRHEQFSLMDRLIKRIKSI